MRGISYSTSRLSVDGGDVIADLEVVLIFRLEIVAVLWKN